MLLFSHKVVSDSFVIPQTACQGPLCPWNFPAKNTGVDCLSFFRGFVQPGDQTCVSYIGRQILTSEPPGKPNIYIFTYYWLLKYINCNTVPCAMQ